MAEIQNGYLLVDLADANGPRAISCAAQITGSSNTVSARDCAT